MVVLHSKHFLPNSDLFFCDGDGASTSHYLIGDDSALQRAPSDSERDPRLPPFSFDASQENGKMLHPFLVILNAEISFHCFRRMGLPPICPDYEELIDLSIELVKLIYHQPLVKEIFERLDRGHVDIAVAQGAGVPMDIDMDEDGSRTDDQKDGNHTIRSSRRSRTGTGAVRNPGPGAAADNFIEYGQYLMSKWGMFLLCLC